MWPPIPMTGYPGRIDTVRARRYTPLRLMPQPAALISAGLFLALQRRIPRETDVSTEQIGT